MRITLVMYRLQTRVLHRHIPHGVTNWYNIAHVLVLYQLCLPDPFEALDKQFLLDIK